MKRTPPETTKRVLSQISPDNPSGSGSKRTMSVVASSNTVGSMSKGDLLEAISTLMDGKLEHLAAKEDIQALQNEFLLVKSECDQLKLEITKLNESNAQLSKRLHSYEAQQKANNLIFKGLPEKGLPESETVHVFCKEMLGLDDKLSIRNAFRLGRKTPNITRPILVEYIFFEETKAVMDKASRLKNTNFVVHRDKPQITRKKRSLLLEIRNELNNKNKNMNAEVRGQQLIVNQKYFYCSDDYQLLSKYSADVDELAKTMGVEMKDLMDTALYNLERRKHYKDGEAERAADAANSTSAF